MAVILHLLHVKRRHLLANRNPLGMSLRTIIWMMIFRSRMPFFGKVGIRKFRLSLYVLGEALLLAGCTPPPPRHPENICEIFTERRAWYRTAVKEAEKWQIPVSVTMSIMYQESGFRGQVGTRRNRLFGFIPTTHITSAYGYAQAVNASWAEYLKTQNKTRKRKSFSDSFDFVDWYIAKASEKLSLEKQDAYHQYLAYHEGISGYRRKTYELRPDIQKAASLVQQRAEQYQEQYRICGPQLKNRSFIRWIFEALLSHLAG
ncbi:hypothetical protein FAI41_05425 [Acetobacteraceae bacterium]|nr:hypothetical protein FAI41_05425 [Acetobacteraceae bacterium]